MTEYNDFEKALKHYLLALQILELESEKFKEGKSESEIGYHDIVDPNIYNNISVLYTQMKDY